MSGGTGWGHITLVMVDENGGEPAVAERDDTNPSYAALDLWYERQKSNDAVDSATVVAITTRLTYAWRFRRDLILSKGPSDV